MAMTISMMMMMMMMMMRMMMMMIMMMRIPIVVTLAGIVTDVSAVHHSKAPSLITVTLVGISMLVIGHAAYWKLVIVVVVVDMVTNENLSVYRLKPGISYDSVK